MEEKNKIPWGDYNIVARERVHTGPESKVWYQKICYHCESQFLSSKANTVACCRGCTNTVSRRIRLHGSPVPLKKFKKLDKVDFSLKKHNEAMGATTKKEKVNKQEGMEKLAENLKNFDFEEMKKRNERVFGTAETLGMASPIWAHSKIMRNVVVNCYNAHKEDFDTLPELALDPNDLVHTPRVDVGFLIDGRIVAVLEIMNIEQYNAKKTQLNLMGYTTVFGIGEVFVYIYDKKRFDFWDGKPKPKEDISKSKTLGIDLADYIDLPK